MTHVHPKAIPNWCPQVNPDEAWTARCVKEKIAADGKRHRCQKKVGHDDNVHACQCGLVESSRPLNRSSVLPGGMRLVASSSTHASRGSAASTFSESLSRQTQRGQSSF